jgi:hypothetical protein
MTDQPTPETDAMFTDNVPDDCQIVAFCECLERERNAARADIARLRDALEGMLIAEMEVRQMVGFSPDEVETEPHWMAARAALAQLAK